MSEHQDTLMTPERGAAADRHARHQVEAALAAAQAEVAALRTERDRLQTVLELVAHDDVFWVSLGHDGHPQVLVNVNDIFGWACADAEVIPWDQFEEVVQWHRDDPIWGAVRWVIAKRGVEPQPPVKERIEKHLAALPAPQE